MNNGSFNAVFFNSEAVSYVLVHTYDTCRLYLMVRSLQYVMRAINEFQSWIVAFPHGRHSAAMTSNEEEGYASFVWVLLLSQSLEPAKTYEIVVRDRICRRKVRLWEKIFEIEGRKRPIKATDRLTAECLSQ